MENTPNFLGKQFLQGKEKFMDTGTFTLGTHQFEQLSEQVLYTQCTHTPGYRLQAKESSSELPMTKDGKFQHEGIPIPQCECLDNPANGYFQKGTQSKLDPKSNSNGPRG